MIVAVVDYRAGNLTSVVKALKAVGADPRVVNRTEGLSGANAILVPGVGHFDATRVLDDEDRRVIGGHVTAGVPLLGICLGMQWLFEGSEESPDLPGLRVFPGRCEKMSSEAISDKRSSEAISKVSREIASELLFNEITSELIKIPHVGWNTLERTGQPSRLLDGLPAGASAYFTHSYAAPVGEGTVAITSHGTSFASVVERGRVFGTQFHPEKSGAVGLEILRRFVAIVEEAGARC